jgi:GT2 family glycosyltransferase
MTDIDIIFVSNAFNDFMRMITDSAIRTVRNSGDLNWNVYVVEQTKQKTPYKNATTLYYDFPFNYNACLNVGIQASKSPYVALCNNDLVFYKGWGENIIKALQGYKSASPSTKFFEGIRLGYKIEKEVLGWCIVVRREIFEEIGELDTPCTFWYSDNVYADQLKRAKIQHALVGNSVVRHMTSVTLNKVKYSDRADMMRKQAINFTNYKSEKNVHPSIEK